MILFNARTLRNSQLLSVGGGLHGRYNETRWMDRYPGWDKSPIFRACITPAVDDADTKCLFNLGVLFATGVEGTTSPDVHRAVRSYQKAAEAGSTKAMFNLAVLYETDGGVQLANASTEAARWFQTAAGEGLHTAQLALGGMYERGDGVGGSNTTAALEWYTAAGNGGLVSAQFKVATMFAQGVGVDVDHEKSTVWFKRAAESNHTEAQLVLGVVAEREGDDEQAVNWLRVSEAHFGLLACAFAFMPTNRHMPSPSRSHVFVCRARQKQATRLQCIAWAKF